jgi:hypothetical protein
MPSGTRDAGAPGKARKAPSKRRRKPVLINIDGEEFVVSSEYEAEELITRAKEAAEERAESQAAEIVKKRESKAARGSPLNTSPLRLDEPTITVTPAQDGYIDQSWVDTIRSRFDEEIRAAYDEVKLKAETALLLHREMELDEEDSVVALLLTL